MPQIETWSRLPAAIQAHLVERMHDRKISIGDLNQLRVWMSRSQMCPRDRGTKTLDRLSFAERADIRKRFFLRAKLQQGRSFSSSALRQGSGLQVARMEYIFRRL